MDDVISSIQTSSQTQEQKITSLDTFNQNSENFISDVVRIDGNVADVVKQRKDDFYDKYYYLKPECEKSWLERKLDKACDWCRKTWNKFVDFLQAAGVFQMVTSGLEIFGGVVAIVVGVLSLVGTLGLSTPASIAAIIGGIAMITHGSGGFQEGLETYSGNENPRNWLRDATGNTAYNVIGIGGMILTAGATGGVNGLLALGAGWLAGEGSSYAAHEWFGVSDVWSQYIGLGAGMVTGFFTFKGLNYKFPKWGPQMVMRNPGKTTLSDWNGNTEELAKTSPIEIPDNATVKTVTKAGGYDQISYKWSDGTYKYEVRWHTKTPGAPASQGNTWVVERTTPGTPTGQRATTHILTGEGQWTPRYVWQEAITAYQNGVATEAQKALLEGGHWLAP